MSAIDLVVLGIVKQQQPIGAYDIQKIVEYRNISKWVKISTPSIYKKVLSLEEKGLLASTPVKEGSSLEKTVYRLTPSGEARFAALMEETASQPLRLFLDLNAVVVNLPSMSPSAQRRMIGLIENSAAELREHLEKNLTEKRDLASVPPAGLAVLEQQATLVDALVEWLEGLKRLLPFEQTPL